MKQYKIGTIGHSYGRVKGYHYTSPLQETMKSVTTYHKQDAPILLAQIKAEIANTIPKERALYAETQKPYANERTRKANNLWAKWNRADDKLRALQDAVKTLEGII